MVVSSKSYFFYFVQIIELFLSQSWFGTGQLWPGSSIGFVDKKIWPLLAWTDILFVLIHGLLVIGDGLLHAGQQNAGQRNSGLLRWQRKLITMEHRVRNLTAMEVICCRDNYDKVDCLHSKEGV